MKTDQIATPFTALGQNTWLELIRTLLAADPLVLAQELDFDFSDVVIARAAWLYAQTDPMMQPRVQTLEEQYKDMMYQLIERDTAFTDTPDQNEIIVPVQNDIYGESTWRPWPVANRR